jgi:hypothetical protein
MEHKKTEAKWGILAVLASKITSAEQLAFEIRVARV